MERKSEPARWGWETLKESLSHHLLLVFGILFLGHLIAFWFTDWIVVGEPSKLWLILEILVALGVIALGVERLRKHSKSR